MNENQSQKENSSTPSTPITPYSGPLPKRESKFTDSIGFKLIIISVLTILLLLPASWIKNIIRERESLNRAAVEEVSSKWAGEQKISGPILSIPIIYKEVKNNKELLTTKYLNVLPQDLIIDGKVMPEKLNRGIYDIVVYKSELNVSGNFKLNPTLDTSLIKEIQYEKAFITVGISDLRGIKNKIEFKLNKQQFPVEAGSKVNALIANGVTIQLPHLIDTNQQEFYFNYNLSLQGSKQLAFLPMGSYSEVNLTSPWQDPSFVGNYLPDNREVNQNGFKANWKILALNKNFPSSFIGNSYANIISNSAFGVDLIVPLDDYQKSFRSVKYAIMTISLTFLIFFLIEVLNKQRIHPLQYTLVGLALCLFYILLVAISEHTNFNLAYSISTFAIVAIISLYSLSIFKAKRMTWILISLLIIIYSFLFVTLQLTDYALLMGSIGLVVILGGTMYFTRKVNWYELKIEEDTIE